MLSCLYLWLLTRWPHKAGMKDEPHHSTSKGGHVALRDGLMAATTSNSQYVPNFNTARPTHKKESRVNHLLELNASNESLLGCCSVSWCQLRVQCTNALVTYWTIPALVWACTLHDQSILDYVTTYVWNVATHRYQKLNYAWHYKMQQRQLVANLCYYVGVTIWTAYGTEHVGKDNYDIVSVTSYVPIYSISLF